MGSDHELNKKKEAAELQGSLPLAPCFGLNVINYINLIPCHLHQEGLYTSDYITQTTYLRIHTSDYTPQTTYLRIHTLDYVP